MQVVCSFRHAREVTTLHHNLPKLIMNAPLHLMQEPYGLMATGPGAAADMCASAVIGCAHAQVVLGKAEDGNLARVVTGGKEDTGGNSPSSPLKGEHKKRLTIWVAFFCLSVLRTLPSGGWGANYILSGTVIPNNPIPLFTTFAAANDSCSLNSFVGSSSACRIDFSW